MLAKPDRATPINLAQHSYYNLAGSNTCRDHCLWLDSLSHSPIDSIGIPTGEIVANTGTRYDFTTKKTLNDADPSNSGYDMNMLLHSEKQHREPAAIITADNGRSLIICTDHPGL